MDFFGVIGLFGAILGLYNAFRASEDQNSWARNVSLEWGTAWVIVASLVLAILTYMVIGYIQEAFYFGIPKLPIPKIPS